MRSPDQYSPDYFIRGDHDVTISKNSNGPWVAGRPEGNPFNKFRRRMRLTWLVFTGKADALVWLQGQ